MDLQAAGPPPSAGEDDDRAQRRALLERYGAEAGHWSTLGPDPWRALWNESRTAFVAYLETRHVIFLWRTPVGPEPERAALLAAVADLARRTRRTLICAVVDEPSMRVGAALGLRPAWAGTECFFDLRAWSISGGRRQKVRWARSHAVRLGYAWREARPVERADDWAALAAVEAAWKAERPVRRTDSFLRNDFTELMADRRYFVCEGAAGVVASVTCTPINARAWYLQDPVREPDAPRGALEGAMALALDTFRDEGYEYATNGPLAFHHPDGSTRPEHPLGAMGDLVVRYFDHRYHFSNINRFRSKFEPDWVEPLYVLRSRRLITPGAATSLTRLLTQRLG